jgi:hypothetical protein
LPLLKISQDLDKLLNHYNKNPTLRNKAAVEAKRQELYEVLKEKAPVKGATQKYLIPIYH